MRLLLLAYPWLELLSLIQLGIKTNALIALGYVLIMLLLGTALLRFVGVHAMSRLREAQRSGLLQQHLLVDDLALAVAALLLMIPGLVSDVFAVVVLIGPLRRAAARVLGVSGASGPLNNDFVDPANRGGPHRSVSSGEPVTLDGDFETVDRD